MNRFSVFLGIGLVLMCLSLLGSNCQFGLQEGSLTVNVSGDGTVQIEYGAQNLTATENSRFIKAITPGTQVTLRAVSGGDDSFVNWQVTRFNFETEGRTENPTIITTEEQGIIVNANFE
ncbi:hypothetical protein ACFL1X_04275 [Candidatus Hydrogenedentota bacterium]